MANYVLLERIELNASALLVTFSNIPQSGYTDLKIVYSTRAVSGTDPSIGVQINGATANLSNRIIEGNGASATSVVSSVPLYAGSADGSGNTASTFANGEIYIPNYNSTSTYKSISIDHVNENNGTTAYLDLVAGLYSSNTAITSVGLYVYGSISFAAYSTFSLYGLAAAGTTPSIAPKASGGNIATDGTYWYHAFLASGVFTPQTDLSCDLLVVAGGGGGGGANGYYAGGGGAGGLLGFSSQAISANTAQTVTVGAGGSGGTNAAGTQGGNSTFGSLTSAVGGGYGGGSRSSSGAGGNGGSGGGAARNEVVGGYSGGTGTSGQGNNGGPTTTGNGSGGGGAGAAGTSGDSTSVGGNGATYNTTVGGSAGPYAFIDAMGAATSTGQLVSSHYYYAGGGGGGTGAGSTTAGGYGGGGLGTGLSAGQYTNTAGTANTGGGGGGDCNSTTGIGKAGGSGIVIIRYTIA